MYIHHKNLQSSVYNSFIHDCQTLEAMKMPSSSIQFSCSVVSDSESPRTAACQASLPITNSWSLLKFTSIELVMPSNYLILWCPLLLLPSIFPSIKVLMDYYTGTSRQCNITHYKKEMHYQAMRRHGTTLNAYYKVKEGNGKRLHTIWFLLYDMLEKAKLWREEKKQWLPRGGGGWGLDSKAQRIFRAVKIPCVIT